MTGSMRAALPKPFFESPSIAGVTDNASRRLLLVTYHFPPDTAVGGLRWEQLSRHFAAEGWGIDVIARDLTRLTARDERRLRGLPPTMRIFAAAEGEPASARAERLAIYLIRRVVPRRNRNTEVKGSLGRSELARPSDGRRLLRAHGAWISIASEKIWARAAARIGIALARNERYDLVVGCGPPHMAHEAARRIAKAVSLPLVVDFRDPWSGLERLPDDHASPLYFTLLKHYERAFVRQARLVVMNTDRSRDDMRARYPEAADRVITVRNGSDDEPLPRVVPSARFTIRFAGSICLDRDPTMFFRAAAKVVRHLGLTRDDFGIELIGTVEEIGGRTVREIAAAEGVADYLDLGGSMPRDAAMRFLAGASVLLNLPQDSDLCVPAKIFEYVRFNAWLLVLASEGSATAETLRDTTADIVDPQDVDRMALVIEQRYLQHARGERPVAVGRDGRFDREHQARLLLEHLTAIVGPARTGGPRGQHEILL
jgi:hypothetical protein